MEGTDARPRPEAYPQPRKQRGDEVNHEGSSRHQLRSAARNRGRRRSRARPRAGARPDRGVRPLPHRHPRRPRRVAGQADPALHPRPRGRRHRRALGGGNAHGLAVGDARRAALARLRLRRLPLLQLAAGRRCASRSSNTGYSINGGFAEYAVGYARHVVRVPDGDRPRRRRAADLRRRDDLQGGQGRRARRSAEPGRRLRRRRPRPPGGPVREDHRRRGRRGRHQRRATARPPRELGADHVVNATEEDPVAAIKRLGGADAVDRDRRHARRRSSRPSARSRAAARSSASACPPRTA